MRRSTPIPSSLFALACAAAIAGCAPRSAADGASPAAECILLPGPPGPASGARLIVTLTEEVDPDRAPDPATDAERFLFRHLYDTLLRVDCAGRVLPALASEWTRAGDGREWRFTLRDDARFWDGTPVTAHDVVASWRKRESAGRPLAHLLPWDGARSAQARDLRTVVVSLAEPRDELPREFAHPALAVTGRAPWPDWPLGSGPYALAVDRREATDGGLLVARPVAEPDAPVLEAHVRAGADPRDLLDRGVDLLWTDDRRVLDYAAKLARYDVIPLGWHRTYALVTAADPRSRDAGDYDDLRAALARDAVSADARPFEPPPWGPSRTPQKRDPSGHVSDGRGNEPSGPPRGWWDELDSCSPPARPGAPPIQLPTALRRVVYPRGDDTAREIAERLVALSVMAPASRRAAGDPPVRGLQMATPLGPAELRSALAGRGEAAYVVSLPRRVLAPCYSASTLLPGLRARDPAIRIVPLVDTRRSVIVRRGLAGLALDGEGTLRLLTERARDREMLP